VSGRVGWCWPPSKKSNERDNIRFIVTCYEYVCQCEILHSIRIFYVGCLVHRIDFYGLVTHTHTHPFNGPLSGTTRVSRYQKCETNMDFTEARDSEWQWHQLGNMQVCTSLQTDNHASTQPLSFLQTGCPSCCPTNSVKALKARLRSGYSDKNRHN